MLLLFTTARHWSHGSKTDFSHCILLAYQTAIKVDPNLSSRHVWYTYQFWTVLRNCGPQSILQLLKHSKLLSLLVVTRTIWIIYLVYSEARSRRRREGESKSLIVYVKGEIGSKQASLAVTTLCCVVN